MEQDYSKIKIQKVQEIYKKLSEELEIEEKDFELRYKLTIKNHELEKRRITLGLKQEQVAYRLGLGVASYSAIESCRQYPNPERQSQIAKILGSSVDTLFPEWLKIFSSKWKDAEKSKIVPIDQLKLNSPEVLSLESGDYNFMERNTDNNILKDIILKVINDLNPREANILKMRFGIGDHTSHTLEETAKEFGITRERIRQLEFKALEKIRNNPNI